MAVLAEEAAEAGKRTQYKILVVGQKEGGSLYETKGHKKGGTDYGASNYRKIVKKISGVSL